MQGEMTPADTKNSIKFKVAGNKTHKCGKKHIHASSVTDFEKRNVKQRFAETAVINHEC